MLRLSTTKSFDRESSLHGSRRSSQTSSKASSVLSRSTGSTTSSSSSGASIGSWDQRGANDVHRGYILINDKFETVSDWYDNASIKPLPGQHPLRDDNGNVITAVEAAKDRKLKETLKFTGLTGRNKRMTFVTVKNAVQTQPLRVQAIDPITGQREPWEESSIQRHCIPDYSAATEKDEMIIAHRKRHLKGSKSIIIDGEKVKPHKYYENVNRDNHPSVEPFPGQDEIYSWAGNYAEVEADREKRYKERLQRYVGYQKKGNMTMRSFRTASYDDAMGGVGKPVNFMLDKK